MALLSAGCSNGEGAAAITGPSPDAAAEGSVTALDVRAEGGADAETDASLDGGSFTGTSLDGATEGSVTVDGGAEGGADANADAAPDGGSLRCGAGMACCCQGDTTSAVVCAADGTLSCSANFDLHFGAECSGDPCGGPCALPCPDSGRSTPQDASADADAQVASDAPGQETAVSGEGGGDAEGTGTGIAHIVVTNTTAGVLYVYLADYLGGLPEWLHIGSPELSLIGFGGSLCTDGSHYDPFFRSLAIPANGEVTYDWSGGYMEMTSGCWQQAFAPAGSYPAKACAYAYGEAGAPLSPLTDAGVATCVDFTVPLPKSGQVTSRASW